MTEGMPPMTPHQIRQLNRDLMEKMLDKAESDPAWKQRLLDDPEAAMMEAGFPETQQLRQAQTSALASEEAEVAGHMGASHSGPRCAPYSPSGIVNCQEGCRLTGILGYYKTLP